MGAQPYWYFTEYQPDFDAALQELRQREFRAGRYNPVVPFLEFPLGPESPSPGSRHASIEEVVTAAGEDGTRSILDLQHISTLPDFGVAAPLGDATLLDIFETTQPNHVAIETNMDFFEQIERGHGIYIIVCESGKPSELFFAGYSYD